MTGQDERKPERLRQRIGEAASRPPQTVALPGAPGPVPDPLSPDLASEEPIVIRTSLGLFRRIRRFAGSGND